MDRANPTKHVTEKLQIKCSLSPNLIVIWIRVSFAEFRDHHKATYWRQLGGAIDEP